MKVAEVGGNDMLVKLEHERIPKLQFVMTEGNTILVRFGFDETLNVQFVNTSILTSKAPVISQLFN